MKFERPNSNIVPFGTNANENKRFAFGTNNYTNDINENLNDSFKLGWETVGINSKPPRQWFNGLAYTSTYLTSYLFQTGIPEWNENQEYYINSITKGSDGNLYLSLVGEIGTPNVGNNPVLGGSSFWKSILDDVVKTSGNQTIAGVKTFNSTIVGSINGNSTTVTNGVYTTGNQTINGVKTFSASPIVPTPTTGTQAVNKNYVDNITALPIGAILNGYTIFNNCIVAFGGEFNRADYPELWAYLQANPSLVKTQTQWQTEATANGGICGFYSSGNGTTTFRVPNLDKAFLRPDSRGVGSYQSDEFKSHSHNISGVSSANVGTVNVRTTDSAATTVVSTSYTGSTETRPKNIAVLPLIIAI